jgi:glyceraldehyde-3-phosphate dehydrogenase/erythrose-4-phosphate dehydrogenase
MAFLDWTDEEAVSTDFVSCKSSSIFDVSTSFVGTLRDSDSEGQ